MSEAASYQESFEELEQIVTDLEQGEIPIDELTTKVSRGAELIKICGDKLKSTEKQIGEVLKELSDSSMPDEEDDPEDEF